MWVLTGFRMTTFALNIATVPVSSISEMALIKSTTMLGLIIATIAFACVVDRAASAADLASIEPRPNSQQDIRDLRTLDEYVKGSQEGDSGAIAVSMLGMSVMNGSADLDGHGLVRGVKIVSVMPGTPAAIAGMRSQHAAVASALTAGFFVAGLFFPPALLGAAIVQGSGVGESCDLIIAVDGQRAHNIQEFGQALANATSGELVYVVLVRAGRRHDLVVALH
jgi:S1-C subfamily serine protease